MMRINVALINVCIACMYLCKPSTIRQHHPDSGSWRTTLIFSLNSVSKSRFHHRGHACPPIGLRVAVSCSSCQSHSKHTQAVSQERSAATLAPRLPLLASFAMCMHVLLLPNVT